MDIKIGVKLHNRFDVEVKDITTGEIVQTAYAENIVTDDMWPNGLVKQNSPKISNYIKYGRGTGILSKGRTTLFSQIAAKSAIDVEFVYNLPPLASYGKKKIIITPSEAVGETITEVGISSQLNSYLLTHALLKDAEGNQISIGPKTETQEITIYSTIFAEVTMPEGMLLTKVDDNYLLRLLCGASVTRELYQGSNVALMVSEDKSATNQSISYYTSGGLHQRVYTMPNMDVPNRKASTGRIRLETTQGKGKIWSIVVGRSGYGQFFRMLLPCPAWPGYNFEGKIVGLGDGTKTKFVLPWSDINDTKEYRFYKDGVLQVDNTDYTLENSESETSITFTTAPAVALPITGDWWVDYIPKDETNILDMDISIVYAEGV